MPRGVRPPEVPSITVWSGTLAVPLDQTLLDAIAQRSGLDRSLVEAIVRPDEAWRKYAACLGVPA